MSSPLPPVWLLTDPDRTPDPLKIMQHLPLGWGVLYRHFGESDRLDKAVAMKKLAKRRRLFLSASYDPAIAKLKLDGVHWPRWMSPMWRSVPRHGLQTSSAHDFRQVQNAVASGMDACFTSAVFNSESPCAPHGMGVYRFKRLCAQSPIPLIALGGVNATNAEKLAARGAFAAIGSLAELF